MSNELVETELSHTNKLEYEIKTIVTMKSLTAAHSLSTANASKLIEKCFLDLRNIFSNQENIRKFFSKKKIYLAKKNFLVPSTRKFILILENGVKMKRIFLKQEIFSRLEKFS